MIILNRNIYLLVLLLYACSGGEKKPDAHQNGVHIYYQCQMHHEVISDKPGKCPKCGMQLIKKSHSIGTTNNLSLESYLLPTNEFVITTVPLVTMSDREENIIVNAYGTVDYDLRQAGVISARISGRIEKLYLNYKYQKVSRGDKILEIYSPEILSAESNLVFITRNDPENKALIESAKQKLLLLGMSEKQIQQVIASGKILNTITIYSNYDGHIHDNGNSMSGPQDQMATGNESPMLSLREGAYIEKGQVLFKIVNEKKATILLQLYQSDVGQVSVGNEVELSAEKTDSKINAKIDYIEPFIRNGSKTTIARIYLDNSNLKIPIGSRVTAKITTGTKMGNWIPKTSIIALGNEWVVLRKEDKGYRVHKIETGYFSNNYVLVKGGLSAKDSIVKDAQYLMDRESFIIPEN